MNKFKRLADFSLPNDSFKYVTLYQVNVETELEINTEYSVRVSDDDGIKDIPCETQAIALETFNTHTNAYIKRKFQGM